MDNGYSMRGQQIGGGSYRELGGKLVEQRANQDHQQGIEVPEPASIFTETALSINGHTNSIRDMAATVRRCCDLLVGSEPERVSESQTPEGSPHQIPRLNQALCEHQAALQYLQSQLLRLDAALAGNTPR